MKPQALIVDDELNIQKSLSLLLSGLGYEVRPAGSGEDALRRAAERMPWVVFLDVQLPGMNGMATLAKLREMDPDLPVIMISGHATIERAVEATRLGAFDFLEKPFARDRVVILARNASESHALRDENARLRSRGPDGLLGESPVIQELRRVIAQVAPTDARVLILGESGTGKELVAQMLHAGSPRAKKPFVRVNCAAIPEELIEAELFGAVRGAYTGAVADRPGRFLAANGGTLFLDEIADMSLKAQVKVLRVLQEGEFEPVGSTETHSVDVRVLAATHQNLEQLVEAGRFREDLWYRLNVVPVRVPALRERGEDIALLVEHFVARYAREHEVKPPALQPNTRVLLWAHSWPGNVRELKNIVERLVILKHGTRVGPEDLPAEIHRTTAGARHTAPTGGEAGAHPYAHLPLREARDALERDLIQIALRKHDGNVTRAAQDLGLERTHLHKRLRALEIDTAREEE